MVMTMQIVMVNKVIDAIIAAIPATNIADKTAAKN